MTRSSLRHRPRCNVFILSAPLILAAFAGTAPVSARNVPAAEASPEYRGMWVTRFEWPGLDRDQVRATIDEIMSQLARSHFNAVFFQVRGQADTLYPSPEEPWSALISTSPQGPGWDPLQHAIEAAHRNGLEFHAYINTHVAWQDVNDRPPPQTNPLYYRHCNAADPAHRDWLIHDEQGRPVQFDPGDHYTWIAPGVPDAQAYIRRQILYVAQNYDVDGLHFDRIRTCGPEYSHDPISTARQALGAEGNPGNLNFADWTRDQFTRMLCDLYAQVAEVKPQVKISAAPVGLYRRERNPDYPASFHFGWSKAYQDAQAWIAAGALDFVVPQIYWGSGPKPPFFDEIAPDWFTHAAGRHVVPGQNRSLPLGELVRQVRFTRDHGGHGNVMFAYKGFASKGGFKRYSGPGGPYERPARLPAMPWKDQPTEGILLGTLTDEAGQPVVDGWVTRTGGDEIALSSGDGLYSMLRVPPGTYALTIRKQGYAEARVDGVQVAAGRVTRVDVPLAVQLLTVAATSENGPARASAIQPAEDIGRALAESTAAWKRRWFVSKWLMPLCLALPFAAAGAVIYIERRCLNYR